MRVSFGILRVGCCMGSIRNVECIVSAWQFLSSVASERWLAEPATQLPRPTRERGVRGRRAPGHDVRGRGQEGAPIALFITAVVLVVHTDDRAANAAPAAHPHRRNPDRPPRGHQTLAMATGQWSPVWISRTQSVAVAAIQWCPVRTSRRMDPQTTPARVSMCPQQSLNMTLAVAEFLPLRRSRKLPLCA